MEKPNCPTNLDLLNVIFEQTIACMQEAEKKCRKYKAGQIEWSPEYQAAAAGVQYWKMLTKQLKGGKVNQRELRIQYKTMPQEQRIPTDKLTPSQIKKQYFQACQYRNKIAKTAFERRDNFMRSHDEANAKFHNTSYHVQRIQRINREQQRRENQMMNASTKVKSSASISSVDIPTDWQDEHSSTKVSEDQIEMEEALITHLHHHFKQVYATPAGDPAFIQEFGLYGTNHNADKVYQGEYTINSNLNQYTQMLLKELNKKMPHTPTVLQSAFSRQEFQKAWRAAKEKTTSSPHNAHFGHFKAIATDRKLSTTFSRLMSIPMIYGIVPTQYKKMTAIFLQKKHNVRRANKLRTIWLLDSFFSGSIRILAKRTTQRAEAYNMMAKEQFGSRKNHDAKQQATNMRLSLDLIKQIKSPTTIVAADLTSCYDRIGHSLAAMCLRKLGHQVGPLQCRFQTVQQLVVNVRTSLGDSTITNQDMFDTDNQPPQGVLQGSPDGPIIWAILSSLILQCLREAGYGAHFKSAIQQEQNKYLGCVFVDDATYIQTSPRHCAQEAVSLTQESQTLLEGLSKATGGAINPNKSFWWMVDFVWHNGVAKINKDTSGHNDIKIKDKNDNSQTLIKQAPNSAEKILGVYQAPLNDGKEQTKALRKKIQQFTNRLQLRRLPTHLAWLAIQTRAYKAVEWPLQACTLSEQQCAHIIAPLLKWGLRSIGVQSNLNRNIVFGPPSLMGLGFNSLYTSMGIDRSLHMLNHGQAQSMTGKLLRGTYEQLALEIGLPGELFEWKYLHYARSSNKKLKGKNIS